MTERWEEVGRRVLSVYIHEQLEGVESATYHLMVQIAGDDEVSPTAVRDVRQAIFDLLTVFEEDVTPVVDGVEPYGDTAGYLPISVLREHSGEEGE